MDALARLSSAVNELTTCVHRAIYIALALCSSSSGSIMKSLYEKVTILSRLTRECESAYQLEQSG